MVRSLHFWPRDLRPTPEPFEVPSFDERLAPAPARTVPVPPVPSCQHQERVRSGKTASGNQRLKCKHCTRTFVEKPGNNNLKPAKQEALRAALLTGISVQAAARKAGVSRMTAFHYRNLWAIHVNCECGRPAGHRGWCAPRLRNSPKRQALMARLHGGISEERRKTWEDVSRAIQKSAKAFGATQELMDAARVMIGGLLAGFDLCRTAVLTGVEFSEVERFAARFRKFGIWKERGLATDCFEETKAGDLGLWLDAMVGEGTVERDLERAPDGQFLYRSAA